MANYNYTDLLARVTAVVYSNESQEIKASKLQQLLIDVVDSGIFLTYDTARNYTAGAFTIYNDGTGHRGYICQTPTTGVFTVGHWIQLGI